MEPMEIDSHSPPLPSQSIPPPPPQSTPAPEPSQTIPTPSPPPPPDLSQNTPLLPLTAASAPADEPPQTIPTPPPPLTAAPQTMPAPPPLDPSSKKRRRRKKQFPEMIPTSRSLRPAGASSAYNEKLLDRLLRRQIGPSRRQRRPINPANHHHRRNRRRPPITDLHTESLIALAVGFPIDSLTEEELLSNVLPFLTPSSQSAYITIRNHILALFRSNPTLFLTEPESASSIRSEHRHLVSKAYAFLHSHSYINFGIIPKSPNPLPSSFSPVADVIIIGAGLAGLAAARQLQTLNFKVLVLEGRRRPGGRVLTKKMVGPGGSGDVYAAADLGGSVLTGINGNPFGVLARQLGFPLHKVRDVCPLYLPDGRPVDPVMDTKVEAAFNKLLDKVCKLREAVLEEMEGVDVSLGTALDAFQKVYGVAEVEEEKMLLNWHLANLEYANASSLSDLSMAYWDQDDPYEMGGDHCFIPGGNGRFVKALAENVPILYDRTVSRVHYGSDGVMVCANGQVFRSDIALVTVPLGVLKKGSIKFVPELPPQKLEAIKRLGFGLLNKVAMLFPHDFWGGEIDTFGHLTKDSSKRGEFFLFYSYSSVSGGPLLVALVAGESAIRFEETSPVEPVERVMNVLRGIFCPKGINVPDPLQVICTRWGSDKFTYGSYSYVAIGSSGDDYDVLAESIADGRIFFAGEATNRRYPATMHGALLSGFREAANISRAATRKSKKIEDQVEDKDLDNLFQVPDLSFGRFLVLFDPVSNDPGSSSLVRAEIGEGRSNLSSLFLYGLISRNDVKELHEIDGDDRRLSVLYERHGAKLVERNGLGNPAEALIARIKAARRV